MLHLIRVLWVSETVKSLREQYSPHTGGRHYDRFISATNWAKTLADDYDDQIKGLNSDLEKLRLSLREAACVDLAYDLASFAQVRLCRPDAPAGVQDLLVRSHSMSPD